MLKTWEEIKSFDDIILENERKIISDVEKEAKCKCPILRKGGQFFYYCGKGLSEIKDKSVSPTSPIYQRKVDFAEMQLHCMGDFEKCCFYSGRLRR